MELRQRTITHKVSASGISLHSGENVEISFLPAGVNTGIVFRRNDLEASPEIKADYKLVSDLVRNTTIGSGYLKVATVEHVLSALRGMGIDNAIVDLNGSEPPIFDGSATRFVELLHEAVPVEQDQVRKVFELAETVSVIDGDRSIIACPHDGLKITCTFADAKGNFTQHLSIDIDPEVYEREIARARTFTFYEDIEELIKKGKIKGGSLDSAIVIKDDKVMSKEPLRYDDELVRHKILDIIGDLSLLGSPLKAHIIAIKPGHAINTRLTSRIGALSEKIDSTSIEKIVNKETVKPTGSRRDIGQIMAALPHRYPFLMVDRVLEISEKTISAIKNVTINEPYFNGHFPGKPVMPGVLQIEAMAQVAGILLLEMVNESGKLALFMSCDKAKFRKVVIPGDQLVIRAEMLKTRAGKMGIAGVTCSVDGVVVSSAELTFALIDDV
jgi:UDP-3-O-[3-hydroxymyristoyl] N-acetylglucosamine deacetylase / 3-hydroxyacyl-[acyl-carrier-protein] dehydratase